MSPPPLLPASKNPFVKHGFPTRMHLDHRRLSCSAPIRPPGPPIPSTGLPGSLFSHADRAPTYTTRLTIRRNAEIYQLPTACQISQDQCHSTTHMPLGLCQLAPCPFSGYRGTRQWGGMSTWRPVGSLPGCCDLRFSAPMSLFSAAKSAHPLFAPAACALGLLAFCTG